jgi:hypothetical protein
MISKGSDMGIRIEILVCAAAPPICRRFEITRAYEGRYALFAKIGEGMMRVPKLR